MKRSLLEITGFSKRNFQLMIQFQREYAGLFEDPQRPVAELPEASRTGKIWPQPVAEINPNDSAQPTQGSGENEIVQQAVAQLPWVHTVILSQKQKLKKNDCFAIMLTQDLLTRGIDEHGNLRSEQTHHFKDSPIGRIPVEWEVVLLGNVSTH